MAQNVQASAQPTCELTHTLTRAGCSSGMRTVSTRAPSGASTTSLVNGSSADAARSTTVNVGTWPTARTASAATRRTALDAATRRQQADLAFARYREQLTRNPGVVVPPSLQLLASATRLYGADRVKVQGKLVGLIRRY